MKLTQVPGAVKRLALFLLLALGFAVALAFAARALSASFAQDQALLRRSERVTGTLRDLQLPPLDERDGATAQLSVLYQFDKRGYTGTRIEMDALSAEGLGPGAKVDLYVDPLDPDHPREVTRLQRQATRSDLLPYGFGLGLLLGLGLFAFELRQTVRRELEPLRKGALVWLTPDEPLPETRSEIVFKAHYFRADNKHEVRARGRPGRAPVRNGQKILAAVVPSKPRWVRVVDEDLARTLGWMR